MALFSMIYELAALYDFRAAFSCFAKALSERLLPSMRRFSSS
jgi:hypothetical protein